MRILIFIPVLFLTACGDFSNSTDSKQAAITAQMTAEAERQVGMPAITNFTERKFAKMILELRDQEISTFTYIVDMNGKRHFLCESIGFGIPYSTQFTNPERIVTPSLNANGHLTLPQPDPNGLFMPASSSATWVLAVEPEGPISPIYVESEILVSTFKLH